MGRIGSYITYIQPVSIGYSCTFSAVLHEIGHVLGFYHEQSRPDRDKYVTIHHQNIIPGAESNFRKVTDVNSLGVTYDFNSIMHYYARDFAKPGTITISAKERIFHLALLENSAHWILSKLIYFTKTNAVSYLL